MAERTANEILDECFLETRAKLLEIAATLDRVDRAADAGNAVSGDSQQSRAKIDDAIRILLSEGPDRAERLQLLFSREYSEAWRDDMQI